MIRVSMICKNGTQSAATLQMHLAAKFHFIVIFIFLAGCSNLAFCSLADANSAYNSGEFGRAIALYKQAAKSGDNPALCHFNIANAFYQLDSLPKAVVYYRACVTAAPGFFKAWQNLAVTYYALLDMCQCIAAIERAIALCPDDTKAQLIAASAYRASGSIPEAIAQLRELVDRDPTLADPPLALGELYRDLGDPAEAIRWFLCVPPKSRQRVFAMNAAASLYETQGDFGRAISTYEQSFAIDSTKPWTLYRIVVLQKQSGNDLLALSIAREAMERFPDFAEIAVLAGTIAFERNRYSEAEHCYKIAQQLGSSEAVAGLSNLRKRMLLR